LIIVFSIFHYIIDIIFSCCRLAVNTIDYIFTAEIISDVSHFFARINIATPHIEKCISQLSRLPIFMCFLSEFSFLHEPPAATLSVSSIGPQADFSQPPLLLKFLFDP
jgi:hypothetical protein